MPLNVGIAPAKVKTQTARAGHECLMMEQRASNLSCSCLTEGQFCFSFLLKAMASLLLNATAMKNIRSRTLLTFLALCAAVAPVRANPNGPNKVQYFVNETMTATGVDADATGRVQAFVKQKGDSDHQRLHVHVAGLDSRTSYTLLAQIGTDTNLVAVTNFMTGAAGKGNILYLLNRRGASHGRQTLPDSLNPLTDVRTLAVANTNGEIVLSVNLHQAVSMKFELASVFSNTGNDPRAIGCVAVTSQDGVVQFRLLAAGQSSEYTFYVNETPVATYQADLTGTINVGALPDTAPSPLSFRKLSVRNAGDQVVLQSDLTQ